MDSHRRSGSRNQSAPRVYVASVKQPRADMTIGVTLIVVGGILCSLAILAAFTPIGLVSVPAGAGLIFLGVRRTDRPRQADGGVRENDKSVQYPPPPEPPLPPLE